MCVAKPISKILNEATRVSRTVDKAATDDRNTDLLGALRGATVVLAAVGSLLYRRSLRMSDSLEAADRDQACSDN